MFTQKLPIGVMALFLMTGTTHSQNLITNAGFEYPVVSVDYNLAGAFSFPGWYGFSTGNGNGTGNAGVIPGINYGLAPFEGSQHFSFNGDNPPPGSFIEQTFSTSLGQQYNVSLSLGRSNGLTNQFLQIRSQVFGAGGLELASLIATPPLEIGYTVETFAGCFAGICDFSRRGKPRLPSPHVWIVMKMLAGNPNPGIPGGLMTRPQRAG